MAFGWALPAPWANASAPVPCAGGAIDERWFIVGVLSPVTVARLCDELRCINDEHTH